MDKIFVFGVPSGGLFGLRQLRKRCPDSIIYVIAPKTDIGYHSNVYDRFYEVTTKKQVHEVTLQAYKDIGEGEVWASIYSNKMLEYIVDSNKDLFDLLHFENSYETFKSIVDKVEADRLCRKLGLPRPIEYDLTNESQYNNINYPIVVKPLEKQKAIGASKCVFLQSKKELEEYLKRMLLLGIAPVNFTCQQYIRGDNRWEYGYGGYFKNGQPVIDICFYQFRQKPQGLCCYTREMTDRELKQKIKNLATPVIEDLNYNGFMEFDIKQDEVSGTFYVLDINPRPWGSVDMLNAKLRNSTVFLPNPTENHAVWKKIPHDFIQAKGLNVNHKICKKITGTSDFKCICALFDVHDLHPFVVSIFIKLKGVIVSRIPKVFMKRK